MVNLIDKSQRDWKRARNWFIDSSCVPDSALRVTQHTSSRWRARVLFKQKQRPIRVWISHDGATVAEYLTRPILCEQS